MPNIRRNWPDVWGAIKGLKVRLLYTPPDPASSTATPGPIIPASQGRLKTIYGYGKAADIQTFQDRHTGSHPTVKDYFEARVITVQLDRPKLPVINVGDNDRKIWVPIELLSIEGQQAFSSTLQQRDMDDMAKIACKSPAENLTSIEGNGHRLLQTSRLRSGNVVLVEPHMATVAGRLLRVPPIRYKAPVTDEDLKLMANGKWDLKNKKFHTGSDMGKFLVIHVGNGAPMIPGTREDVRKAVAQYGVKSNLHSIKVSPSTSVEDLNKAYGDLPKGAGGKAVLIMLPKHDAEMYTQVKQWGELIAGVQTICVTQQKSETLLKPGFQANLAVKFNAKLGGRNHIQVQGFYSILHEKPGDKSQQTMVLGADVTHPSPSSLRFCPSIAAVVASTNGECVTFPGSMRLQASKQEQITDLRGMVQERLQL